MTGVSVISQENVGRAANVCPRMALTIACHGMENQIKPKIQLTRLLPLPRIRLLSGPTRLKTGSVQVCAMAMSVLRQEIVGRAVNVCNMGSKASSTVGHPLMKLPTLKIRSKSRRIRLFSGPTRLETGTADLTSKQR